MFVGSGRRGCFRRFRQTLLDNRWQLKKVAGKDQLDVEQVVDVSQCFYICSSDDLELELSSAGAYLDPSEGLFALLQSPCNLFQFVKEFAIDHRD